MEYNKEIVATADIHLCEEYYKYISKPFEELKKYIKERKPLITVISGDYFNSRVNADEDIYHYAIQSLLYIKQYTKHLIIIDGTFSHDYNTLEILKTYEKYIENIHYVKEMKTLKIEGLKILCLPEEYPENKEEYYKKAFENRYDYIFGHGDIEGALLHNGADNSMLKGWKFSKKLLSEIAKYTIFGHFHKHQFITKNVLYIGSLARFKFGEEEDKGYISITEIYSENPKIEFKVSPTNIMNTIVLNDDEDIKEILKRYKTEDEIKIKIPKGLKEDLLKEIEEYQGKVKIDYLIDNKDNENEVEYKDIEKMDILNQFLFMYEKEVENKKIPLKHQKFITKERLKKEVENLIREEATI